MKLRFYLITLTYITLITSGSHAMKEKEPSYFKNIETFAKTATAQQLYYFMQFLRCNLNSYLVPTHEGSPKHPKPISPAKAMASFFFQLQECASILGECVSVYELIYPIARTCGYATPSLKESTTIQDAGGAAFLSLLPAEARPTIENEKKKLVTQLAIKSWDTLTPADKNIHGLTVYLRAHAILLPIFGRQKEKITADVNKVATECEKRGYADFEALMMAYSAARSAEGKKKP